MRPLVPSIMSLFNGHWSFTIKIIIRIIQLEFHWDLWYVFLWNDIILHKNQTFGNYFMGSKSLLLFAVFCNVIIFLQYKYNYPENIIEKKNNNKDEHLYEFQNFQYLVWHPLASNCMKKIWWSRSPAWFQMFQRTFCASVGAKISDRLQKCSDNQCHKLVYLISN